MTAEATTGEKADRRRIDVAAARRAFSDLLASYDAAEPSRALDGHWARAKTQSANDAASPAVRRRLRDRARHEVANNSTAKGIVLTLANDVVGTGPRVQFQSQQQRNRAALRVLEDSWREWSAEVDLVEKIRTLFTARVVDGEGVARFIGESPGASPVRLDLVVFEADRLTSPSAGPAIDPQDIDGVILDRWGRPREYTVARYHPAEVGLTGLAREFDRIRPDQCVHYFRQDRPEQARGIPYLTPALNLFALLRRFTLATVLAAETAANIAAVIHSDVGFDVVGDEEDGPPIDPGQLVEFANAMLLNLPPGHRIEQMKAEHPTTAFEAFRRAMIVEIARCLNMPANVALGDSSSYNYASGRLDHQTYDGQIRIERATLERKVLDRVFRKWLANALTTSAALPANVRSSLLGDPTVSAVWHWPAREHVDPLKEAQAAAARKDAGLLTDREYFASRGMDWEEQYEQAAREAERRAELGLDAAVVADGFDDDDDEGGDEAEFTEEDDDDEV